MILGPYQLANKSKNRFVTTFKDLFEHSPWVVEQTFSEVVADEIYQDLAEFHKILSKTLQTANAEQQLEVINYHPQLAGKKAQNNELTDFSTTEQKSAGLNNCSEAEIQTFAELNQQYLDKFNFPFILAVKGKNKTEILQSFAARLKNPKEIEIVTSITEINKIAWLRLQEIYGN